MSTLHHESIYETCFDEAYENFRTHNKLTNVQMEYLMQNSRGVRDAVYNQAYKMFDDMSM